MKNVESKTIDDIWTVAAHNLYEFKKKNFGGEPEYVFVGSKQWTQLHDDMLKFGVAISHVVQEPELMGAKLVRVCHDDFFRFTA